MLKLAGGTIRPAYPFGIAGLLAGVVWSSAPDDWGPAWSWTLGLIFALLMVLAIILDSSALLPLTIRRKDAVWSVVILSAAWPASVLAFGLTLIVLANSRTPPVPSTFAMLAMFVGVLGASLCVWAAVRVLTKTWRVATFFHLFFSGEIVVVLSFAISHAVNAHQRNGLPAASSPRLALAVLSVLGSALYGYFFGLGLLRTRWANGAKRNAISSRILPNSSTKISRARAEFNSGSRR